MGVSSACSDKHQVSSLFRKHLKSNHASLVRAQPLSLGSDPLWHWRIMGSICKSIYVSVHGQKNFDSKFPFFIYYQIHLSFPARLFSKLKFKISI
jgi:hypothetical protein